MQNFDWGLIEIKDHLENNRLQCAFFSRIAGHIAWASFTQWWCPFRYRSSRCMCSTTFMRLKSTKRSSFQILQKRMSHCAVRKGKIHTSILVLLCRSKICKIFPWGWQLFFFLFFLTGRNGLLIFASGCFKAKADNAPTSPTQTESQSPSSV